LISYTESKLELRSVKKPEKYSAKSEHFFKAFKWLWPTLNHFTSTNSILCGIEKQQELAR
jgi:hypothetical protein